VTVILLSSPQDPFAVRRLGWQASVLPERVFDLTVKNVLRWRGLADYMNYMKYKKCLLQSDDEISRRVKTYEDQTGPTENIYDCQHHLELADDAEKSRSGIRTRGPRSTRNRTHVHSCRSMFQLK